MAKPGYRVFSPPTGDSVNEQCVCDVGDDACTSSRCVHRNLNLELTSCENSRSDDVARISVGSRDLHAQHDCVGVGVPVLYEQDIQPLNSRGCDVDLQGCLSLSSAEFYLKHSSCLHSHISVSSEHYRLNPLPDGGGVDDDTQQHTSMPPSEAFKGSIEFQREKCEKAIGPC